MNKQLLLLVGFLVLSTVNAQENPSVEKNQFKINILLPGVVYEHGFDEKHTLYSELSTGFGIQTSSTFGTAHAFYPAINEQFRHYYNLGRRSGKGKVTANNSGGFVALNAIYNFKAISSNELLLSSRPAITIAPVWGFQRTYKGNFNLALNAGVGYQIRKYNNRMATVLNFSLGWVIK